MRTATLATTSRLLQVYIQDSLSTLSLSSEVIEACVIAVIIILVIRYMQLSY